jgi:outer membrane beta-barrel protein
MRSFLLVAALLSTAAYAQKSEEEAGDTAEVDKDALSPLRDRVRPVSGHLFLMKGRFELSPGASFSVRDAFFSKYVIHLALAYHLTEELGIKLRGGYAFATPSGTAQICQTDSAGARNCRVPSVNELVDKGAYGLTPLLVDLDLEWAPLYGKLAFLAEAFIHFNFYIDIGANLVLYQNSLGGGAAATTNVTVGGNVGVGMRWFFTRWLTARLELRDVLYYEASQQYSGSFRNQLMLEAGISIFLPTNFEEKY